MDKASKPIGPGLDKGHHEKEMKIKQACKLGLHPALMLDTATNLVFFWF